MNLSVIIPTYNRRELLRNVLGQLSRQPVPAGTSVQITVVADGSSDGTQDMIRDEFPDVRIVEGTGDWYYTKSMNEGFKSLPDAKTDYVLTLNDDIILCDRYIERILESVNKVEPGSVIGSITFTNSDPKRVFFAGVRKFIAWRQKEVGYCRRLLVADPGSFTGIHPSIVLPGRGMLIPYNILTELNFFDETFKQYLSDYDFCFRAREHGYQVYVSHDAQIISLVEKTGAGTTFLKTSFLKYCKGFFNPYSRLYIPNKARYYFRHGNRFLWPVTMIFFFITNIKAYFFNKKIA
jgi:GT2 family glycosyltransferase